MNLKTLLKLGGAALLLWFLDKRAKVTGGGGDGLWPSWVGELPDDLRDLFDGVTGIATVCDGPSENYETPRPCATGESPEGQHEGAGYDFLDD